jgi:hypothetical protein
MAYWIHTKNPMGQFVEKEVGNYFEYSANNTGMMPEYLHLVWVGGLVNDQGYRYANVKQTVAYIAVDEDDDGLVIEKWDIKKNIKYATN